MNVFTYLDSDAFNLTADATSLNSLLKNYLIPLGWEVVDEINFVLRLTNENGHVIKIKDTGNRAYFTGYRSLSDAVGFPTPAQITIDGEAAVICSRVNTAHWYLFANSTMFYLVIDGELTAFGFYTPLFHSDEITTHILIGNQQYLGSQTLLTNVNIPTTLMFLDGNSYNFPFSQVGGLAVLEKIDDFQFMNGTQLFLAASPIIVHDPVNTTILGFMPDLFGFNSTFSHEGFIYSLGGYDLYCVNIAGRCFGVKIND